MSINFTLFGQMITFGVLVWFTMKFVWPPLIQALDDRKNKIAEGLAAADRGASELEDAKKEVEKLLKQARSQASEIVEQAHKRANKTVEEAKDKAREESERIVAQGRDEIAREVESAKQSLKNDVSKLAIEAASKILSKEIDPAAHATMIDKIAAQL